MPWQSPTTWTRSSGFRTHLDEDGNDLLREMVKGFAEELMSAEADGLCGAGYGDRTPARVNSRNGYRQRDFDTRAGTIPLAIPKLRSGTYFPEWLLQPRRRAEQALTQAVTQCYVEGVSTRRVDDIVKKLEAAPGIEPGCRALQALAVPREVAGQPVRIVLRRTGE